MDHREFNHLLKLCRLECSKEEEAAIRDSLQNVLAYVDQLKKIDTEGVASCNFVLRSMLKNQMREDEVKDILPREQFLANVGEHQIGGMVRIPPVLKESL
jgi:aspartyl-tRNA(Asn)/glutamyl-tRNA(Gln) amidotransferase subunit C